MASSKTQSYDYMLLRPEKASLFQLARFLLSSGPDILPGSEKPSSYKYAPFSLSFKSAQSYEFVECTKKLEGGFRFRWYISISIMELQLLHFWEKPMALVGQLLEMWLNLLSQNGGFFTVLSKLPFMLLLKLFSIVEDWGTVVRPDSSSETFTSVLGFVDTRVELDKSIRHDDPKYKTTLAMMASKLAYENEAYVQTIIRDHWSMEHLGFYNFANDFQVKALTKAIMFQDTTDQHNLIVVAFRGTGPFDPEAWRTDVNLSWVEEKGVGKFHCGFINALGMQEGKGWPKEIEQGSEQREYAYYGIRQRLRDLFKKNKNAKFILTGHSLGGALAILFVTVLAMHEETWLLEKLEGVYTFGQPRVGDHQLGEYMEEKLKKYGVNYFRYTYCNDLVPRIPYDDEYHYSHFARCHYYNRHYEGKVLPEEPSKSYFSLLWAISKFLNAVLELIRSFTIPYVKGPEYEESWLMKMIRMVGLVMPGISAHFPQDYVNVTRLGSCPKED